MTLTEAQRVYEEALNAQCGTVVLESDATGITVRVWDGVAPVVLEQVDDWLAFQQRPGFKSRVKPAGAAK